MAVFFVRLGGPHPAALKYDPRLVLWHPCDVGGQVLASDTPSLCSSLLNYLSGPRHDFYFEGS